MAKLYIVTYRGQPCDREKAATILRRVLGKKRFRLVESLNQIVSEESSSDLRSSLIHHFSEMGISILEMSETQAKKLISDKDVISVEVDSAVRKLQDAGCAQLKEYSGSGISN